MGWGLYKDRASAALAMRRVDGRRACRIGLGVALIAGPAGLGAQTTPQPTTPTGLPTRQQVEQPGPQSAPTGTSVSVDCS